MTRGGPCTSYSVKELFRASPSELWSGSAGAIYPLMKRLEERGLLASEEGATGRRRRRTYRATSDGREAFHRWLVDAERAAGMGFDPLRTRLVFLGALSPAERADFRAAVDTELARVPSPSPTESRYLRSLHRIWLEARVRALERALAAFEDGAG